MEKLFQNIGTTQPEHGHVPHLTRLKSNPCGLRHLHSIAIAAPVAAHWYLMRLRRLAGWATTVTHRSQAARLAMASAGMVLGYTRARLLNESHLFSNF